MAELIPPLNSCSSRMQAGEKRFARRLISHLEDDYLCWYETGIGYRPRYTDFVILHPIRGLLLLEVKDWHFDTIRKASPDSFEILTNNGLKNVANPHRQARQCSYKLVQQLEKDDQLVHLDGKHKGKLLMPWGYGVVFSRITRRQFDESRLGEVIPEVQTICKDEMAESLDMEEFQKRLWDMFNYCFHRTLTQPQIDRVRWHLFPEIRMNPQPELQLQGKGKQEIFEIPDIIKVMDIKQEKLARGLGAGHRVIHGVAGSGKTMILGYRCMHLARLLNKPILVLCYNVTLAARLQSLIDEQGVNDKVNVYSIHSWANTILKTYNLMSPKIEDGNFDARIETLIEQVGKGNVPRGQYGAILIDEGHDFKREWLRLVVDMVDPDTNSLLLLYDDTQSIYKQSSGLGFKLKDVGIEAQGRSTILKLNYRNTEEILKFAFDFIGDYVKPNDGGDSGVPIIEPDSAGRSGPSPVIEVFRSFDDEAKRIANVFSKLHSERGRAWSEMCVLYCHNWMGKAVCDAMEAANIPFTWLKDSKSKHQFNVLENSVKIITMHSSKGLEFPTVAACGVGSLGVNEERIEDDAKLLYVALTRATQNLLVTSSKESPFTVKLQQMIKRYKTRVVA
ncbi:MAG TPA: 3'-5' exonuclease [Woeseiaceae bacterium]|nr:3'-5' exonuclease [Woeseiaceae bacterium]